MPYLYRAAQQAHTEGVPMMRAMVLEFPGDPACTHLERQYMLDDDLLVAPVFRADGGVSYYVPDGTWTHVLTGAEVTGPRWHRERHSFLSVPLLARPGSVIPVGAVEDRPDYDYADGVTLHVYQLADGASRAARIPVADPRQDPLAFTVTRTGRVIRVTAAGRPAPRRWQVLLAGIHAVGQVAGGTAATHPHGTLISTTGISTTGISTTGVTAGQAELEITLG